MSERILISVVYLTFGLMLVGMIGYFIENPLFNLFVYYGSIGFLISGVYLIAKNGGFIKTHEYRIALLGVAIMLVGAMFKIQHYPFSKEILALGYFSILLSYPIYMFLNKQTEWRNFVKLIFLTSILTGKYFKIIHFPYSEQITFIGMIILIVLVVDFLKTRNKIA